MTEASTAVNRRWRLSQSAPGRWTLFLVIVWSIAGAFIFLDAILTRIATFAAGRGLLSDAAPAVISVAAAAERVDPCKESVEQWGRTHSIQTISPKVHQYSSEFAWRMGFEVGRVAGPLGARRTTPEKAQQFLEYAGGIARSLEVPTPILPKFKRTLRTIVEFGEFVERDPQCIAAQLARNFSPKHAHLYQLGEAIGFSTAYRMLAPEMGNVLVPLVHRHGKLADLPKSLWIEFARETEVPLPGSDPQATFNAVVQPFHDYFACKRRGGIFCSKPD